MRQLRRVLPRQILVALVLAVAPLARSTGETDLSRGDLEMFEQRIRPVFILRCFRCHSAEAQELASGLSLESREALLRGGRRGPAIVPGNPDESLLVKVLKNWTAKEREPDLVMPPDRRLSRRMIEDVVDWIRKGARWPQAATVRAFAAPEGEWDWARLREQHWAWQPVRRPSLPVVDDPSWPETPVDFFVLAKLEAGGLVPAPRANRRLLVRRIYFDLLGLPPDPSQVEAFVADRKPDAYARLVDRLLASPRYGERWGRHWLDVARYSDGFGAFQDSAARPLAFRYRDWVVDALNADMPYDEFVRLQIAGDLLASGEHDAAVGFFAVGPTYTSDGGSPTGEAEARAETLDDRVDTLARGLLGLTVACARCHDHKFDPIPTQDYYSLAGVFNNTVLTDVPAAPADVVARYDTAASALKNFQGERQAWEQRHEEKYVEDLFPSAGSYLREALRAARVRSRGEDVDYEERATKAQLRAKILRRWTKYVVAARKPHFPPLASWYALNGSARSRFTDAEIEARVAAFEDFLLPRLEARREALARGAERPKSGSTDTAADSAGAPELDAETEKLCRGILRQLFSLRGELAGFLSREESTEYAELLAKEKVFRDAMPPKYPMAHSLRDLGNADMRIAQRGDFLKPGPIAPRRFLRILAGAESRRFRKGSGRVELAQAVVAPENPLTARVFVNRVWRHHFGRALVRTPSNFGLLGETPTHPKLLDWLASEFVHGGWSLKALHRTILLSAAYQMSSAHDERSYAIDGDNRLVWRMNPRRLDVEVWRDGILAVSDSLDAVLGGEPTKELLGSSRRTLYTAVSRNGDRFASDDFLRLFDFPSARVSNAKRIVSTVPQQYLFMLNSPFMVGQAKLFAERLARDAQPLEGRIERAYVLLFSRLPQPEEKTLAIEFLNGSVAGKDAALTPWERYAQVLLSSNEFLYVR